MALCKDQPAREILNRGSFPETDASAEDEVTSDTIPAVAATAACFKNCQRSLSALIGVTGLLKKIREEYTTQPVVALEVRAAFCAAAGNVRKAPSLAIEQRTSEPTALPEMPENANL